MKPSEQFAEAMNKSGQAITAFARGIIGLVGIFGLALNKAAMVADQQLAKG